MQIQKGCEQCVLEGCLEEVGFEGRQVVRVAAGLPGRANCSSQGSKYRRPLRVPTKENALALIAVGIGGKNTQE